MLVVVLLKSLHYIYIYTHIKSPPYTADMGSPSMAEAMSSRPTFDAGEHTLHLASAAIAVHPDLESDGLHLLLLPPLGDTAEQVGEILYGAFNSHGFRSGWSRGEDERSCWTAMVNL